MTTINLGGLVPHDWQARVIASDAPRMLVQGNRRCGKTTAAAATAVHDALNQPGSRLVTVSPRLIMARELRSVVATMLTASGANFAVSQNEEIWLANGSKIINVSGNTPRGFQDASLAIFDEASVIDDAVFEMFPNSRLLLLGTPMPFCAASFFQRIWNSEATDWQRETASGGLLETAAAA